MNKETKNYLVVVRFDNTKALGGLPGELYTTYRTKALHPVLAVATVLTKCPQISSKVHSVFVYETGDQPDDSINIDAVKQTIKDMECGTNHTLH